MTEIQNVGEVLRGLKDLVGELGVMSDSVEPYVINDLGRKHDVHIDFYSLPSGKLEGLKRAKKEDHPPQTNYVFVGSGVRDETVAQKAGWEYIDIDDAIDEEWWPSSPPLPN
ncbi:MAG: hypothetical protein SV377_08025 [Halobacteria archaeon]|nr:hypothetical protein [Halobacteria archaeon]